MIAYVLSVAGDFFPKVYAYSLVAAVCCIQYVVQSAPLIPPSASVYTGS